MSSAPSPARRRSSTTAVLPFGAILLAVLSTLGAYGTVFWDRTQPTPHSEESAAELARFVGTFPPERGPDGLQWQWMKSTASIAVRGRGKYWLAFRALSLDRPRSLLVAEPQKTVSIRVAPTPMTEILGPFIVVGSRQLSLAARPGARRATKVDKRQVSIFLTTPLLSRDPAAALPGSGFAGSELDRRGVPFTWLSQDGHLDLVASPPTHAVWLSFAAMSPRRRLLIVESQGFRRIISRTVIPGDGKNHAVALGPITLVGRRSTLIMRADPGPERIGSDPRSLSIRLTRFQVAARRPALTMGAPR
jgi:hypothetical protein